MKTLAFLKKTFLENLRDWKILVIALAFAPFFVYLMYGYFLAAATSYKLLVMNLDRAWEEEGGGATEGSVALVGFWREARHPDGKPVFIVVEVSERVAAVEKLRGRDADLLVEIPRGFSQALASHGGAGRPEPPRLVNRYDTSNARGSMAMALSDYYAYTFAAARTGAALPLEVDPRPIGEKRVLSEFDLYVPALLVLAIVMILFTSAATLVREVDKGTMSRLMLSRLGTARLMAAVSVNQVLIGVAALALAWLAAWSVGYRSEGSAAMVLLVGALGSLGVVALGVLTAACLKSIFELLTIGTFPFFILMFFSECMFPLPKITLFHVAGNAVYANDVLPTTLAVRALNKVLNHGAGPGDIVFEIAAMLLLTAAYFVLGTWLFRRRHMRV